MCGLASAKEKEVLREKLIHAVENHLKEVVSLVPVDVTSGCNDRHNSPPCLPEEEGHAQDGIQTMRKGKNLDP